ncbi:hypothetical protein Pcinc_018118 [Petrolisthes cinctipes]|uniref:Uncharacterized protein n=1 Tax=Petrolisthes cinctipes TaxID=88211 RepID=A0AAE1KP51_PETCI|nr:hypothetical protein Pcinc_018118 [Petrolisthes cinctipes]
MVLHRLPQQISVVTQINVFMKGRDASNYSTVLTNVAKKSVTPWPVELTLPPHARAFYCHYPASLPPAVFVSTQHIPGYQSSEELWSAVELET